MRAGIAKKRKHAMRRGGLGSHFHIEVLSLQEIKHKDDLVGVSPQGSLITTESLECTVVEVVELQEVARPSTFVDYDTHEAN